MYILCLAEVMFFVKVTICVVSETSFHFRVKCASSLYTDVMEAGRSSRCKQIAKETWDCYLFSWSFSDSGQEFENISC